MFLKVPIDTSVTREKKINKNSNTNSINNLAANFSFIYSTTIALKLQINYSFSQGLKKIPFRDTIEEAFGKKGSKNA